MRHKDILRNPEIMKNLRWDFDKEKLSRTPFNIEDAGYYFCILVRDGGAALALLWFHPPDGQFTEYYIADFPEDMILASLKEAGGSTGVSGYYPINRPIEDMLRLGLMVARKEGSQ